MRSIGKLFDEIANITTSLADFTKSLTEIMLEIATRLTYLEEELKLMKEKMEDE
jgi:hypothetical protein|tara:strand:+ start:3646 stop:3807 length:162 start_codon:yes stop_codon:yes gene_type:complete